MLPRDAATEGNNCTPVDPQLIVFRAGNGDSTLFRWHNFNMLIDGGIYYAKPCFWEAVHRLPEDQKLDVVVVTHSDADHLQGVLRIFEEHTLPIKVGKLYTTVPLVPQPKASKELKPMGTKLWHEALHHMVRGSLTAISNLVTDPTEHLIYKKFPNGDTLEIFMLTPTQDNLDKAAVLLPYITRLTVHNKASASLLIKCFRQSSEQYKYALLTGDASGIDIMEGLKTANATIQVPVKHHHYQFDYIDMPHHGSEANDPKSFLSKLKTSKCVISTKGHRKYKHPSDSTLKLIAHAIQTNHIERLHLTYPLNPDGKGKHLKEVKKQYMCINSEDYTA